MIIMAAGMIAAFMAGAYIRKPFALIKRKNEAPAAEEMQADPEIEKAAKKINEQIDLLMGYTGPKRGDRT